MFAGNAYGWAAPGQQQPPTTPTPEPPREYATYQPDEAVTT